MHDILEEFTHSLCLTILMSYNQLLKQKVSNHLFLLLASKVMINKKERHILLPGERMPPPLPVLLPILLWFKKLCQPTDEHFSYLTILLSYNQYC